MKKENWIWMPHAAHFICGHQCRFKLATYVGKYIVSTVGELVPDSQVREIEAKCKGVVLEGIGEEREIDWFKKCGYSQIGYDRTYETMVFKARKSKHKCCPYEIESGNEIDFIGCNDSEEAFKNHYKLCKRWSRKKK